MEGEEAMQWYDIILKELDENKTYSSKELINLLSQKKPDLSPNTYRWSLNNMVRDGKLVRCGYNSYSLYKEIFTTSELTSLSIS